MLHRTLILSTLMLLLACEAEERIELATSPQEFIELNLNGEELLLNARPSRSSSYYFTSSTQEGLRIEHASEDNRHVVFLDFADCVLTPGEAPRILGTKSNDSRCSSTEDGHVVIGYTAFEMGGSAYCPHLEGVPTELTGTVTLTEWTADGWVEGTFETDPAGAEGYVLTGRFQTTVIQ